MPKIFNFALKIKEGGREGGTCEVLRPCHPPSKKKFGTCTIGNDVGHIFTAFRDFVPEYHHTKFGGNRTTNKGETEGELDVPPSQPKLRR